MKAAVLEQIGQPLKISEIDLPNVLDVGQVLVRILCTGICGSQLQEIDGLKGDPKHLPHLLGHEACGTVEQISYGVTQVKQGDKVVLHWRKGVGIDAPCISGDVKAGPITTFSEYSVVSENRVTRIDHDVPNDLACLLGCALSTALAVVENEAKPTKQDSVCVIGCGGVGLALILAARLFTDRVFAHDKCLSKRSIVESLGATFCDVMKPFLGNVIIDTVGGVDIPGYRKYISLQKGGSEGGGFQPDKDIPRYVQMWRQGKLNDYKKLITHRISLDEINKGISLMRDGKSGRVMIEV